MDSISIRIRMKIRQEYDLAFSDHEASRVSKIRSNVGSVRTNPVPPVANDALNAIIDYAAEEEKLGRIIHPSLTTVPGCAAPPTGITWVRVRTNMRTPEGCPTGYFVPYLGDSDAHLQSSNSLYRDLATVDEVDDDHDSTDNVPRAESDVEEPYPLDDSVPGLRTCGRVWDRAAKRVAIQKVVDCFGDTCIPVIAQELGITEEHVQGHYDCAKYRSLAWRKYDEEIETKEETFQSLCAVTKGELVDSVGSELTSDSIGVLLCRQCYSFDCMQHGIDTGHPNNNSPDYSRADAMSDAERKAVIDACRSLAPSECWFASLSSAASVISPTTALSSTAVTLFKSFRETMGDDFCRITDMLRVLDYKNSHTLRCKDVGAYAQKLPPVSKPKRPRQGSNASKKSARGGKHPNKEINAMLSGRRLDYTPCNHSGACTAKVCICVQTGVHCEKYCACNHVRVSGDRLYSNGQCPRSFKGCNCKSATACHVNQCVCVSLHRECDPDLCKSCGAASAPGEPRGCCNAGLRLGTRHRTVAGRSAVHGWGVFAGTDIPKNALIGEYLGEVITQEEAERRGRVYDELDYSFLFNITEKYAIDSTRLGSKLKYCNHSPQPNCEPRLMRVGGDVRVGIYSKQPIGIFEELFFDYGYGKAGPDWARKAAQVAGENTVVKGTVLKGTVVKGTLGKGTVRSTVKSNGPGTHSRPAGIIGEGSDGEDADVESSCEDKFDDTQTNSRSASGSRDMVSWDAHLIGGAGL